MTKVSFYKSVHETNATDTHDLDEILADIKEGKWDKEFFKVGSERNKKYAEIETKEVAARKRVVDHSGKYVNTTDLNVTYLDSKWFTTLVRSEGFNVRGHFRLQPFGEGLKERKLIGISDFLKQGYTSPARKL